MHLLIELRWTKIGYAAMMFGEKNVKPNNWQDRLKYIIDTYLFFLFASLIANLSFFIFNGKLKAIFGTIILIATGIYTYFYCKLSDKLLNKAEINPTLNYKKII